MKTTRKKTTRKKPTKTERYLYNRGKSKFSTFLPSAREYRSFDKTTQKQYQQAIAHLNDRSPSRRNHAFSNLVNLSKNLKSPAQYEKAQAFKTNVETLNKSNQVRAMSFLTGSERDKQEKLTREWFEASLKTPTVKDIVYSAPEEIAEQATQYDVYQDEHGNMIMVDASQPGKTPGKKKFVRLVS